MKLFFRILLIILMVGLFAAGLLGYIGMIPRISKIMGTDKPRNLGITYTDKITDEAKNKTGVEIKTLSPTDNPAKSISYMGTHDVEAVFSSEELTALAADKPWKYYPVSDTQIKVEGKRVEISGLLRTDRIVGYIAATGGSIFDLTAVFQKIRLPEGMIPFYIKGTGSDIKNEVTINIETLELGRLPVPLRFITPYYKQITDFIEERVDFVNGARVESLTFKDGKVFFKGTLPDLEGMTPE